MPPTAPADRARSLLLRLLGIPGRSRQEGRVARFLIRTLRRAGVPQSAIHVDEAHRKSPFGGDSGNLIVRVPGTLQGPRRLLSAHMDTVPLCVGVKPVVRDGWVHPADSSTGLGADDRAGVAVLLYALSELLRCNLPHPPLTFFFSIQEELGLVGARYVDRPLFGRPRMAFNFDGSDPNKLTIGATSGYRMTIDVFGIPSHAGCHPEDGVSAITIAAKAIADLDARGWHGTIRQGSCVGTSNVGIIEGGNATNVVTPRVQLKVEARSRSKTSRERIVKNIEEAFMKAARTVRNAAGKAGRVEFDGHLDYEAFRLPKDEPAIAVAKEAVRFAGGKPVFAQSNGGLDANWLVAAGIPTVSLGCGQRNGHTTDEKLNLAEFHQSCQTALRLCAPVSHTR